MPLAIFILTIAGAAGVFLDFILGKKGDKDIRKRLEDFFFKVSEGDWTALFKYPAGALLRFMTGTVGANPFSLGYVWRTAVWSVFLSAEFFGLAMIWNYLHVILTEKRCPAPGFGQFLQIPGFMKNILIYVAIVNPVFDYISWTVTRWGLKTVLAARGFLSVSFLLLFFPVFGGGMLWVLYAVYIPLAIKAEAEMMGLPSFLFGPARLAQIFRTSFHDTAGFVHTLTGFFTKPQYLFVIGCPGRPAGIAPRGEVFTHSVFSISFIKTMEIVATETMLPILLLVLACGFGLLLYITRPLTKHPLELVVSRLEESPNHLFAALGILIGAIGMVLKAIVDYQKSVGQ